MPHAISSRDGSSSPPTATLPRDLLGAVAGLPEIVGHLHPQPSLGRRAEGFRQPDRHLDRDPRSPVHRLRERLPGAAQPLGGPGHRQVGELIGTPLAPR